MTSQTTEIQLRRVDTDPGVSERQEADALLEAQREFTVAFHEARHLGREMLERMARMDDARRRLEREQGIMLQVNFPPGIAAAYREAWKIARQLDEAVWAPEWLR